MKLDNTTITKIADAFFSKDAWWNDNKSSISIEIGDLLIEATATFDMHYQYNDIDGTTESVDTVIDDITGISIDAWKGEDELTLNPDVLLNELKRIYNY